MSEAVCVQGLTKACNGKTVIDHLNLSVKSGAVLRRCRRGRYLRGRIDGAAAGSVDHEGV